MSLEELKTAWNAQADPMNQWDTLWLEEMLEFAQEQEREAIIAAMPGGDIVDPQWVCDMIRKRICCRNT